MALAAGWSCDLRTSPRHILKKLLCVLMRRCVAVFREELNQILGPSNMKMIEKQIGCLSLPSTSFHSPLSLPSIDQPLCPLSSFVDAPPTSAVVDEPQLDRCDTPKPASFCLFSPMLNRVGVRVCNMLPLLRSRTQKRDIPHADTATLSPVACTTRPGVRRVPGRSISSIPNPT